MLADTDVTFLSYYRGHNAGIVSGSDRHDRMFRVLEKRAGDRYLDPDAVVIAMTRQKNGPWWAGWVLLATLIGTPKDLKAWKDCLLNQHHGYISHFRAACRVLSFSYRTPPVRCLAGRQIAPSGFLDHPPTEVILCPLAPLATLQAALLNDDLTVVVEFASLSRSALSELLGFFVSEGPACIRELLGAYLRRLK